MNREEAIKHTTEWVRELRKWREQTQLDKIISEIEREQSFQRAIDEYDIATGLRKALEILNKYKVESEVESEDKR